MKHLLLATLLLLIVPFTQAELKGKPVIFVHGLQFAALDPTISDAAIRQGAIEQSGSVLINIIDEFLFYDSAKRLTANSAQLAEQIKDFEQREICSEGCYFITGSTGDLVARYVISRLGQWGIDEQKFNILLSFDIVGAGGGTEVADTVIGLVNGNGLSGTIVKALTSALFGRSVDPALVLGIVNDLRPSIARAHADGQYDVPRLRIAAGKKVFIVSKYFITGSDDGLVPLHSACGSARQEAIDSCSRSITLGGKVVNAKGPQELKYNNFPISMAPDMGHTDIDYQGKLVAVNNNTTFIDGKGGSIEYSVAEKSERRGIFRWRKTYRTIDKPRGKLAIEFFIEEFE